MPRAEEGGSGHYLPGATSSFIDMLPDRETSTFAYLNAFTYYHGSTGASRDLELGGQVAANVKGTVYADTSIFFYQAPWKLLGGQYGAALAVPYVWLDVKANLLLNIRQRRFAFGSQGTNNGFGDIKLLPLMFGWKKGDLKWQGAFGIYAPTGDFKKGALANIGTNYWTFEPSAAASYLSSKYGFELTAFTGFDFNTKNDTTNYQTGDQFYLDGTLAQHLPLFGGFAGAGGRGVVAGAVVAAILYAVEVVPAAFDDAGVGALATLAEVAGAGDVGHDLLQGAAWPDQGGKAGSATRRRTARIVRFRPDPVGVDPRRRWRRCRPGR